MIDRSAIRKTNDRLAATILTVRRKDKQQQTYQKNISRGQRDQGEDN